MVTHKNSRRTFFQALGYDFSDLDQVVPEFTADIGTKQGEKVDYAIMVDGKPAILIECKCCDHTLDNQNMSQLLRYFSTVSAKFGILTNGIVYQFFTDLAETNKMDTTPFFTVDLSGDIDKIKITELEKFEHDRFDAEQVRRTAQTLKCTKDMTNAILEELNSPSEDFVKLLFKKFSELPFSSKQRELYLSLAKTCIDSIIADKVKSGLDLAYQQNEEKSKAAAEAQVKITQGTATEIVTTAEEKDGYEIIKAICAEVVTVDKISDRDTKSCFCVLFDNNRQKPIIKLHFNNLEKKSVEFFDMPNSEKIAIDAIQDLYTYKDRILSAVKKYIGNSGTC